MPYHWNTGWSGAVLVIFFVFSPVLALIVRRKWRIAEIRRMEVMRLVRLAAAEAERAEKETAEVVYAGEKPVFGVDGGGIGMSNCAVCHNPTTNRCKRCKAVKYCSGTCQITHWRQGHKYECHPPVVVNHYNCEPISSNLKGVDIERPEISGNGLGVEGKGHVPNDGFNIAQSVSNVVAAQSDPSILIDRRSDIEVKLNGTNSLRKVSDLKGVQDERPENSGNGLEIEGKDHTASDAFHVDQSVANVVETQSAPSVLDLNRSDSEVRSNDARLSERFSISMSSKLNISSKIDSRNGEGGEKHFMSVSKKASIIDPLSSSFSTNSAPVEMHDKASCNDDLKRTPHGQHANANPHVKEDEFFPSSDFDRRKTSVIDADLPNHPTIPDAPTTAGSLSHASFSNDFQPTPINDETEFKLGVPSNVNSSSLDKSTDDRINKNAREFSAMGSGSINHDKSKTSNFSENYCEGKGGRIDLAAAETITCAGSTDSQSSHNIHLQLNSGLDFDLDVKLSSMKSSSAAANQVISDFRETVSVVIGSSGKVAAESNNGQLKPSSPDYLNDHRASVVHSKSLLRKESSKVENLPLVGDKSLKVDGSLPNGNVSLRKAVQVTTPSPSLSRCSQSELCNHGHGKYKYKTLFPYDNFIRLYNSDKVLMHPCGLVNCGNSCYANVVLQCLAFTRPLTAFILEGFHAKACPKKGWCFSCEFEALLIMVKRGKSPVSPNGIISHIHEIGSNFGHGREEDAHEFLRYSIDALQNACLKEVGAAIAGDLAETTLIQLIFAGYLRSKIKCMRCRGKSERRERMMDLTIDVHGEVGTLEEALARFTASEVLEGDNKYKCERCKSFERAKKQLTILEAPNVLTIALKRYQSGKYGKLSRMVRFSEYLNLAPYMRGSDDNSPVYRLYAVVVHSGHANATFSGHYVCYVKNFQGKWFKADDSEVKEVNLQQVLSQGAYMLLYARCSPRAPRFLRKEMAKNIMKPKMNQDLLDQFRRPPKADSSSDVSSLFSCSDEGSSWSTESTKDSAASDDFADYSFGESSPRRVSVSSEGDGDGEGGGLQGREGLSFLYSVKQYRNLTEEFNGRKNSDWVESGEGKGNVLFRRNGGDRTARQFY